MPRQYLMPLSLCLSFFSLVACQPPATLDETKPLPPLASSQPSVTPSVEPSTIPMAEPTSVASPSAVSTADPTPAVSASPTPTAEPTPVPTAEPTPEPTPTPVELLSFARLKVLAGNGEEGRSKTGEQADETPFPSGISALDVDENGRIWVLNGSSGILGEVTPEIVRSTSNQGDLTYRLYWDRKTGLQQNKGMTYDTQRKVFYMAQSGTHKIVELNPETFEIKVLAGTGAAGYNGDREATEAQINQPTDIVVDSKGNIYFTDTGNHLLRKITPDGKIITIAGQYIQDTRTNDEDEVPSFEPLGSTEGDGGLARQSRLKRPTYLAIDKNDAIYVASDSNTIRRIQNDKIERYIGSGQFGYNGDNFRADLVHLSKPQDLSFGPDGQLYFIDRGNFRVRRTFFEKGELRIQNIVGNGRKSDFSDSLLNPLSAELDPASMGFDAQGNLLIYDVEHRRIRRLEVKK